MKVCNEQGSIENPMLIVNPNPMQIKAGERHEIHIGFKLLQEILIGTKAHVAFSIGTIELPCRPLKVFYHSIIWSNYNQYNRCVKSIFEVWRHGEILFDHRLIGRISHKGWKTLKSEHANMRLVIWLSWRGYLEFPAMILVAYRFQHKHMGYHMDINCPTILSCLKRLKHFWAWENSSTPRSSLLLKKMRLPALKGK